MKKQYITANYYLKIKGRGICQYSLTSSQAKALFELVHIIDMEYIKIVNDSKHNENKVWTVCKGRWFHAMSAESVEEFNSLN